jgi:hypothetical protein
VVSGEESGTIFDDRNTNKDDLLTFGECLMTTTIHDEVLNVERSDPLKYYKLSAITPPHRVYLRQTEDRMRQLNKYHQIGQEYVLPIPYLCQIYHLLNLQHLERVHNLSLQGLKVVNVTNFEPTKIGGTIKFQTMLTPSVNILRMWRQPMVEVQLTLHNPYTIELDIPIYNDKKVSVIFNILPLGDREHKLFIDIYSNWGFPKPILQVLLHIACCLTLFEDLPYLKKLADGNLHRLVKGKKVSNHKTMQLFKRFVDLYGSNFDRPQAIGALDLRPSVDLA